MESLIEPDDIPYLPRGVWLAHDQVRDIHILQAPERAIQLDIIGHAILTELDGERNMVTIASQLAQKFNAPTEQVANDIRDFLSGLVERRMVFTRSVS